MADDRADKNAYAENVRRTRKWTMIGLSILTVVGFAPFVCLLIGLALASATGCQMSEGGMEHCVLWGHDFGRLIYTLTMMGWVMLLTSPLMLISVIGWIVIGVTALRRARAAPPAT
jgi:hypothetical protein